MDFENVYEDSRRAEAYARLEFPGTYFLAYRDLPELIATHVTGNRALDFGCGTGRSTRYLEKLGFETIGIDIAEDMLRQARELDKGGDYRLVTDGNLGQFDSESFDLVLSAFTFDNIPTTEKKLRNIRQIEAHLRPDGRLFNLVSSPEIYIHEWASFSTKDFPDNRKAGSGDKVKIVMTDVDDHRPVEDVVYSDESYRELFDQAGLKVLQMHKPLAKETEPFDWVNETKIAPWVIYVLGK